MNKINYIKLEGNGQCSCKRCEEKRGWNRHWTNMCFKIEGFDGVYCSECLKEILAEEQERLKMLYQGNEIMMLFKDNEEDMERYRGTNLEAMKQQGWTLEETKKFYIFRRTLHLAYPLPILDAQYTEKYEEDAEQGEAV